MILIMSFLQLFNIGISNHLFFPCFNILNWCSYNQINLSTWRVTFLLQKFVLFFLRFFFYPRFSVQLYIIRITLKLYTYKKLYKKLCIFHYVTLCQHVYMLFKKVGWLKKTFSYLLYSVIFYKKK